VNRRQIRFASTSQYPGWSMSLDQGRHGGPVLVQIETGPRSVNGSMSCAMVLRVNTPSWKAAVRGIEAGPGEPLEHTLTAILADMPEAAAAYRATPMQQAHVGLISAAGSHSRREWAERYPHGVPPFEVIGSVSVFVDTVTHEYDRPGTTAVLPRRNPRPHNEYGTTDDFYG
jgi:hypothetical protein